MYRRPNVTVLRFGMFAAEPPSSFGVLLRQHRQAAGLTQEGLAERAGVSAKAISDLERDPSRHPRMSSVALLADALELSPVEREVLLATARADHSPPTERRLPDLPNRLADIVGRDAEISALLRLLDDGERLITLTGPGGVGKTTLALEVARRAAERYPDGEVFVSGGPLHSADLVLPAIARRLGLEQRTVDDPLEQLQGAIQQRTLLLLLDNLEHVLECRNDLAQLLAHCPHLTLLVTSRIPLRVRDEHEFRVSPLTLPDDAPTAELLSQSAAGALFLQRAHGLGIELDLTPEESAAVAGICRQVDGLPLGIELATAWLPLLSPGDLLQRMDAHLDMLSGGVSDLPARQQTMRDTIAWSYDLLSVRFRTVFEALSVFSGGWTLEAAQDVCAGVDAQATLREMSSLLDMSLLRHQSGAERRHGQLRLTMLDTIRSYAAERLRDSGAEAAVRHRHATHFIRLAASAEAAHDEPDYEIWLVRLQREHDNLRATLEWCREHDHALGLELVAHLWRYWRVRGYHREGEQWLAVFLADHQEVSPEQVWALLGVGVLCADVARWEQAYEAFSQGLIAARTLGDPELLALALTYLGTLLRRWSDVEQSATLLQEAVDITRKLDHPWDLALSLRELGNVEVLRDDYTRAATLLDESLAVAREIGSQRAIAWALSSLGTLRLLEGDNERALELFQESTALYREGGNIYDLPWDIAKLIEIARKQGDIDAARRHGAEALALFQQSGSPAGVLLLLFHAGLLAHQLGDYATATTLLTAMRTHNNNQVWLFPPDREVIAAALDDCQRQLNDNDFRSAATAGAGLTDDGPAVLVQQVFTDTDR